MGDAIGLLRGLYKIICKSTNVARCSGRGVMTFDGQPHLAPEGEAMRCETGGFKGRRFVRLLNRWQ